MIKKAYTTQEAANHCNVTAQSIVKWIEARKLKAYKTLGGHRRILLEDLESFLRKNNMPPLKNKKKRQF